MTKRSKWILAAGMAAVAVGAAAVGLLALMLRGQGGGGGASLFPGKSYLSLRLEGEIPEQPPQIDFGSLLERRPPTLRTLVESLDKASSDPKIAAVVLHIGSLPESGWGQVQELRDAVSRFRKSGKPAYAHIEFCGNKEYYLATVCSKIYAVPTGLLGITGLEAEVTFFKGTLEKLGVTAQFEGIGKYKNAPNQFTEEGFTEPHREQMDALLDSLFGQYQRAIAEGRHKTPEQVRALIDEGPYDAVGAKKAGLIDDLKYQDEIESVDPALKDTGRMTPGRYVRSRRGFALGTRPKVALIYAVGDIVPGASQSSPLGGTFVGSDTVAEAVRQARTDDSVKGIVLRVDSPGGSGTASDVIWRELQLAKKAKPVIISMGDVAASGGYYISMASDSIVAEPGTITGSIGVFSGKFSLRGLYDKLGLSKEILTRGDSAALFSEYRPWTPGERAKIHDLMKSFYDDFLRKVADGRRKTVDQVDAVAQGRVWTGVEAQKVGLVDRMGGLDSALSLAKERAGLGRQDVEIVVLPERKGFFETLMEREDGGFADQSVPGDIRGLLRWVRVLGGAGPVARIPFELRIR